MKEKDYEVLLIDKKFAPILTEQEYKELKPIIKDFIECYARNSDKSVDEWMIPKLKEYLPEKEESEIQEMVQEITDTLTLNEKNKKSLEKAVNNGGSKESWLASNIQSAFSNVPVQQMVKKMNGLDQALKDANDALYRTITTQQGNISQNPNLDGFIAEQRHAQTFNLNAEATGSKYRAKVLESDGTGYGKNSVDIVIVDDKGKIVKRYQSKYCKDAKETLKAFVRGDYRGQQKLVPTDQVDDIQTKATNIIKAPDGTTSNPLTKKEAKELQQKAQSGNWEDLNWNDYKTKDLAMGIGRQAGHAAVFGAAVSTGAHFIQKLWRGEKIKGEEVVEKALESGTDAGLKTALAGSLKVGVEKNIIKVIPKGTPMGTMANIAFVAVENLKVAKNIATGKLSVKEGLEKMEQTTVSAVAGLATSTKGAVLGAAVGTVFGPCGAIIGGAVGMGVGYAAGSKAGEAIAKGFQKVRKGAVETVKAVVSGAKETVTKIKNGIKNFLGF